MSILLHLIKDEYFLLQKEKENNIKSGRERTIKVTEDKVCINKISTVFSFVTLTVYDGETVLSH